MSYGCSYLPLPTPTPNITSLPEMVGEERFEHIYMMLEALQYCLDVLIDEDPDESDFCKVSYRAIDDKKSGLLDCHARILGSVV